MVWPVLHQAEAYCLFLTPNSVLFMNLFHLFRRPKVQDPIEVRRVHNLENALKEVRRWNQAKRVRTEDGAALDRMMSQQINKLIQEQGADRVIVRRVQQTRQDYQHQYEISVQDAEQRLVCYRNIILMQGRI